MLALLANLHPDLTSVGEASIKPRIRREGRASSVTCSCGCDLSTCSFWQQVFSDVTSSGYAFDVEHWTNDYRFENVILDGVFTRETSSARLRAARRLVAHYLPAYRKRVARIGRINVAFVRSALRLTGGRVFVDTTKLLTRLTYLLEVPELDVRVVWLTRDVRGYAWSAKRRGDSVDRAASIWKHDQEAIHRILSKQPGVPTIRLRYEDICAAPETALSPFWDICGVAPIGIPRTFSTASHHVLGNNMRSGGSVTVTLDDAWSTGLTMAEQNRVLSATNGIRALLDGG